ncbi:MAG: PDZ domain-containing protein [Saprospiraceae bacterium]
MVPYLIAVCILFPWCSLRLSAQQSPVPSEKKVTITKRTVEADGTEVTETIIKKGPAAENFNIDQYLQENRSDKVQVEVQIEDNRINYSRHSARQKGLGQGFNWLSDQDNSAFLGVETDADEDASQPGIVIQVVRNSAAAQAGLKTNDLILRLNDKAINRWDDLTAFLAKAKPGDKVRIVYQRNQKEGNAEATLTKHSEVKCDQDDPHGFLGVSEEEDDDNDEAGVQVRITTNSAAAKAGLLNGDEILQLNTTSIADFEDISDFMADTKPGDKISITYQRNGQKARAEASLGEEQDWNWVDWDNNDDNENSDWKNMDFDVQQKEACLGVYTEASNKDNDRSGARIINFTSESAAKGSQMLENDVITAINGQHVQNHDDLWAAIAKYKVGDRVRVDYQRNGETRTVETKLKPCQDDASQVTVEATGADGDQQSRRFSTWNWSSNDQRQMRQNRLITIHKGGEGDATKISTPPADQPIERKLQLESFKAYPNPAQGQVTVEFRGAPLATVVSLLDLSGRQLFREELNMFGGEYNQQFDLSEYAKGTLIILVQQGDKSFSDQIVIN